MWELFLANSMHVRRGSVRGRFAVMRDALNATGHPIVFSIDDWGVTNTWQYGTYVRQPRPPEPCSLQMFHVDKKQCQQLDE